MLASSAATSTATRGTTILRLPAFTPKSPWMRTLAILSYLS